MVLEEAYREIQVRDGDREVSISVIKANVRTLALQAAKGHQHSQRMFTDLLQWVEREHKALHDQWFGTTIDYKNWWDEELRRRERLGLELPDPIPHPDHLVPNMKTGQIEIHGPLTKEEKVLWDEARAFKRDCLEEITTLEKLCEENPDAESCRKMLANERRILAKISKVIPD